MANDKINPPKIKKERYGEANYKIYSAGKRPVRTLAGKSGTCKSVKGKNYQYIESVNSLKSKDSIVKELKRNGYIAHFTRTRANGGWVYNIYYRRGAY